jgi:hypothetical protein
VRKLEDWFSSLARVDRPDVLPEVLAREPRSAPGGPSRPRRVAIAMAALAVFLVAFAFVITSFGQRSTPGAMPTGFSSTPAPGNQVAPTWLSAEAATMAAANGDATPSSAQWDLTDADAAAPAVGLRAELPVSRCISSSCAATSSRIRRRCRRGRHCRREP